MAKQLDRDPETLTNYSIPESDSDRIALARSVVEQEPFVPISFLSGRHLQTIGSYFWIRRFSKSVDEPRLFEVEPGSRVLALCRWQADRKNCPTLVLVHGLEGSADSRYMKSTADKAYAAGFNTVRMNQRTCGGTEHLTPTLYNSGLSRDASAIINELIYEDELAGIYLAGFSMGGNLALKYAGENGHKLPREFKAVCAVSPAVELHACEAAINERRNWFYRLQFMAFLRRRMRVKHKLFPELYDIEGLGRIKNLRQFDDRYTAADGGYKDANDYYDNASALRLIKDIPRPTLIIHAQDDPFVPFEPLKDDSIRSNPNVILLAPEKGGHVGFMSNLVKTGDRFWADRKIVEFCKLIHETERSKG